MIEIALGTAAGIWLAVFVLVTLGSLAWTAVAESGIYAAAVLVISGVIGYTVLGISVSASLPVALLGIVVYTAIGVAYAYWYALPKFLHDNSDNISEAYTRWAKDPYNANRDVAEFLKSHHYRFSIRNNKDAAASWVIVWPVSLLIELSHRPVTALYYKIGRILEQRNARIAKKIIQTGD